MRSASGLIFLALMSVSFAQPTGPVKARVTRFQIDSPLPTLPSLMMDVEGNGVGIAQQTARAQRLQGRILWIDATANLGAVSPTEKIDALVKKIKSVGFNTVVFDIKPIVGYTLYPSQFADKLPKWKDQTLPLSFDPLQDMVRICKREGLTIYASMNAFSEGHRNLLTDSTIFTKPGPGFEKPEDQTILYETENFLSVYGGGPEMRLNRTANSLDRTGNTVSVFVRGNAPAQAIPDSFGAVVDDTGLVLATVEPGRWSLPGIPEGGSLLVGVGAAKEFLMNALRPGRRATLRSQPVLVRSGERVEQQIPLMMNPFRPSVRDRILKMVEEVCKNYPLDGVIYDDRLRYGGINADFSPEAKAEFEKFVGQPVLWPTDVYVPIIGFDLSRGTRPGRWYDAWLTWRAQKMKEFVQDSRATVQKARPGAHLAVYAGSWYGEYFRYGSNWGSTSLRAGFSYLNDQYRKTGFAGDIDFLVTGAYYNVPTIAEALAKNQPAGRTVESAGQLMNRCVRDETWAYTGIELLRFRGRHPALMSALQAAAGSSQGVMVFDLSHNIQEFWPVFERAFRQRAVAPHAVPGLLNTVREKRKALDASGAIEPPVIIREGAAGTGM